MNRRPIIYLLLALVGLLAGAPSVRAQGIVIDVGTHIVAQGDTDATIAIPISGGADITDMAGIVQIGDGGPDAGGTPGPKITAINYAGSIWQNAPGGFSPFLSVTLPKEIADPGVSLDVSGEKVAAAGRLMELTVDVSGFPPGDYALKLSGTAPGLSTTFANSGSPVNATINNGSIRVITVKEFWRVENFGSDVENPFLEATVWGDGADVDNDLLENVIEFGAGLDPDAGDLSGASASAAGLPVYSLVEDSGELYLTVQYSQRIVAPCLVVTVEVSTDNLATWDGTEVSIQSVGVPLPLPDGITQLITKRFATPLSGLTNPVFLRVSFEDNP